MPKVIELAVPTEKTGQLISEIQQVPGLIGLRVMPGASLKPKGDIISLTIANRELGPLMQMLGNHGVGPKQGSSITTSEPLGVVSQSSIHSIVRDTNETSWEEIEALMAKTSNMTLNSLVLMAVSGVIATVGIANDALAYVIASSIIAPGFEPIVRISFGLIAGSPAWKRGLVDVLKGYAVMIIAAALTGLLLMATGIPLFGGSPAYLPEGGVLANYYLNITWQSVAVTTVAGIAGTILISTNRSLLIGGVMIALPLIPAAVLIGMAVVSGNWGQAGQALLRWGLDVMIVLVTGLVVLFIYRKVKHSRNAWM